MGVMTEVAGHQIKRTAGVVSTLAIIGIIGFIGWSIYLSFVKPHFNPIKTTTQEAAQIVNPTYTPKIYPGGCASIRVNEYYKEKK